MQNDFISNTECKTQLLQLVAQRQRINLSDIVEQFTVSEATTQCDLENLASQGKVQRVHGGAIAIQSAPLKLSLLEHGHEQDAEKHRIGQAAVALVREGETVFLGSGATVLEVARALREVKALTVITNSLPVLIALIGCECTVVCQGGMLHPSELSFPGHITEQALAEIRTDRVIIGIRAISLEDGLTNEHLPETLPGRAILRAGREVIVVADYTKLGRVAPARVASIDVVQTIVTNEGIPAQVRSAYEARDLRVFVA